MICARGKSKHRTLKLAARVAAGRFTSRSAAKSDGGGWVPLVLRWRRRRQARQMMQADRVTPVAPVLCFPQNHFHFATHLGGRVARPSAPRVFPAVTIYRERIVRDRSWTNIVTINRATQSRRTYARINYVGEGPSPKFRIETAQPFPSSRVFEPIPKPGVRRPRSSFVPVIPATVEVNTRRREELTRLFKTYRRSYEHRPQVFPTRLPPRDTYAPVVQPKRKQIRIELPEELVWRRVQSPFVGADARNANTSEANQRELGRATAETPAQQASTPLAQAPQQQITKIDPSLLDRLTDDVIRRVEQRARIERQRRGL